MYYGRRHGGGLGEWVDSSGTKRPDSQLRNYTIQFVKNYYDLIGISPRTPDQFAAYIADEFVREAAMDEDGTPPVTFNTPTGSRSLERLVKQIAPLSRFKPGVVLVSTTFDEPSVPISGPLYGPALPPGYGGLTSTAGPAYTPTLSPVSGPMYGPALPPNYGAASAPARPSSFTDASGRARPDSELESYARLYLDESYDLRPVGSETLQELKNRIMYVFLRHQGVTRSGATFDSEIGPVTMDEVVRAVSPLSKPKRAYGPVASAGTQIAIQTQGPIKALTTPAPGKKAAKLDWKQLLALVESGMKGYANAQKQAAAAQLMALQQQGRPLYLDAPTAQAVEKHKDNTLLYVGLGVLMVGGLALYAMKD